MLNRFCKSVFFIFVIFFIFFYARSFSSFSISLPKPTIFVFGERMLHPVLPNGADVWATLELKTSCQQRFHGFPSATRQASEFAKMTIQYAIHFFYLFLTFFVWSPTTDHKILDSFQFEFYLPSLFIDIFYCRFRVHLASQYIFLKFDRCNSSRGAMIRLSWASLLAVAYASCEGDAHCAAGLDADADGRPAAALLQTASQRSLGEMPWR